MKYTWDTMTAFICGTIGGGAYTQLAKINWDTIMSNGADLLWMAFVALVSGGAGVLGKHLVAKYLKRKK
ncbi:MAG: hypothetical protein RIQ89_1948 [Bacteroidota bacterium]